MAIIVGLVILGIAVSLMIVKLVDIAIEDMLENE